MEELFFDLGRELKIRIGSFLDAATRVAFTLFFPELRSIWFPQVGTRFAAIARKAVFVIRVRGKRWPGRFELLLASDIQIRRALGEVPDV